jgi:DNA-binding transcriptional MerR regulator
MSTTPEKFTIDDLAGLLDLPKRTIRYYIQQGLVNRPEGSKRGSHYLRHHLEQLLEIQKWQKAGLSLERISELLGDKEDGALLPPPRRRKPGDIEVWSHLLIDEGLELRIDPKQSGLEPKQIRELSRGVMALVKQLKQNEAS